LRASARSVFLCLAALQTHVLLLSQLFSWRELSVFLTFSSSSFVWRALPHSSGAPQHRTFPLLNLHRTRVRRNHGQPRSNGFIERARNTLPDFTAQSQRASDKALTFLRRNPIDKYWKPEQHSRSQQSHSIDHKKRAATKFREGGAGVAAGALAFRMSCCQAVLPLLCLRSSIRGGLTEHHAGL